MWRKMSSNTATTSSGCMQSEGSRSAEVWGFVDL